MSQAIDYSQFTTLSSELALISFVEQARAESREKLFSDGLTYNASKGRDGNATTFFTRMPSLSTPQGGYFFNLGIRKRLENGRPDNKKFHSFRHTFIELLRNTRDDALCLRPSLGTPNRTKHRLMITGSGSTSKQKMKPCTA
jgi:hypothetical protein